jgi:hypothetical protein
VPGGVDQGDPWQAEVPFQVGSTKDATTPPDAPSTWTGTSSPVRDCSSASAAAISASAKMGQIDSAGEED